MEKRTIFAIALSVLIIVGYDYFFAPRKSNRPVKVETQTTLSPESDTTKAILEPVVSSDDTAAENQTPAATYTLENPKLLLTFDNHGARLIKVTLKEYHDAHQKTELISLINVQSQAPIYPLGLETKSGLELTNVNYAGKLDGNKLTFSKTFENLKLTKTFEIDPDNYLVKLRLEWQNLADQTVQLPPYSLIWEPDVYCNLKEDTADELRVVANIDDSVRAKKVRKLKGLVYNQKDENRPSQESVKWLALSSHYFMAALIPENISCSTRVEKLDAEGKQARLALELPAEPILQKNKADKNIVIYLGPKEVNRLKALGMKMEDNIDFGFFGLFSKFLLYALRYINRYVHNYGWSIVILSVLIKIITYPLAQKSFVSMKKMQKMTPYMNEIKEKYKGNQQKVNQEIMQLYKLHKINPLGGCLPMLIQLPVLFGLFNTLRTAIELRGAPFMFWMVDLAQKDPYYVLPVLMGITMFLQQRMTPVTDPTQAKMMYFMPLLMTFFFMNLSSGLFIYFIVSNVLTVAQQYMINKQLG